LKLIKTIFKTLLLLVIVLLVYLGFIFLKPKIFSDNYLESVTYLNIKSKKTEIQFDKSTICIFLFDPECNSCSKVIPKVKELEKSNIQDIYFITDSENKQQIDAFITTNHLEKYKNKFLIDYKKETPNNFNLGPIIDFPTLIIIKGKEKSILKLNQKT
jgi:hypothetical protein